MQYATILGNFNIPLAAMANFSFAKAANVIPTSRLHLRVRGYKCRELTFALSLTPASVALFNEVNNGMFTTFSDLIHFFIEVLPSRDIEPFTVTLAGVTIAPQLLFTITSTTQSFQADMNGGLQRCDVSLVLSGTRCAKASSAEPVTSDEVDTVMPNVTIHNGVKELACRDNVSISRFELTPTTATFGLILSDSFKTKTDNAWAYALGQSNDAFVEVEGYGRFYIVSAEYLDDEMALECTIFTPEQREIVTWTAFDTSLASVTRNLKGQIRYSAKDTLSTLAIGHYCVKGTTVDTLRTLSEYLGFLTAFRDGAVVCYELPTSLYSADALPFPCEQDIVSSKTAGVIVRDGEHEFKTVDGDGDVELIESPICTCVDRSEALLRLRRFMENQIVTTLPFDNRIRHHSVASLVKDGRYIYCLVTDYTIDLIANTMALTLNYLER